MKGLFIGATSVDLIYPLDAYPREDTKNYSEAGIIDVGGPATNAAFAFSALGGRATLVSLVGNTAFSTFIREKLEEMKIEHLDLNPNERANPALSSIMINRRTGSRTLASTRPPVSSRIELSAIALSEYDVICIDGFHGEFALSLLQHNPGRKPVVFDGGSYKPKTEKLLGLVHYPIFSEGFEPPDSSDLVSYLEGLKIHRYAITHGRHPIKGVDRNQVFEVPVPPVKAIDTLGAGDIFHGAFCYYVLHMGFKAAISSAAQVASLSCQFSGTREWVKHM